MGSEMCIRDSDYVDSIKRGDGQNGAVSDPDKIVSFKSKLKK